MKYAIHDDLTDHEADYVHRKLIEFADQFTEQPRNPRRLGVALRDKGGNLVGGITAGTVWDRLQIGSLWIPKELRGQGLGHQLLGRLEHLGRRLGCREATLHTFDFEAREFYEAHGYSIISQTDDFPTGHTQFHLKKTL